MSDDLHIGDLVYSPRFGRGTVLRSEQIENYWKVTIRFENGYETTIRDPAALHLEKIGEAPRPAPPPPAPADAAGPPSAGAESAGLAAAIGPTPAAVSAGVRGFSVPAKAGGGTAMDRDELRRALVEALEEVCGPAEAPLGERWRGGVLIMKPGREGTQSKEIPIDIFFQKIVRLRDQLRVMEQKINAHPALPADEKVALQHYITRCYGSLTTFNVLFKEADDRFMGSGAAD